MRRMAEHSKEQATEGVFGPTEERTAAQRGAQATSRATKRARDKTSMTIALIGGIGAGKSCVARLFAEQGAGLIDLDAIGHQVLVHPQVKTALVSTFGSTILNAQGEVVRARLAQEAFATPERTARLNAITHPAIMAACERTIAELSAQYPLVVVEVTAGDTSRESLAWADAVVAVSAPEGLRLARAVGRGKQTEADVRARLVLQPTDEQREAIADHVIHNNGSIKETRTQVEALYQSLVHP